MFQSLQPEEVTKRDKARKVLGVWRKKWFQAIVVGLCGVFVCLALALLYLHSQIVSSDCAVVEEVEFTVDELIALKERVQTYQSAHSADAFVELSDEELSFVISNRMDIKARIFFSGDDVEGRAVIPARQDACYNVDFKGKVIVEDGIATFTPSFLLVGALDLTRLLAGRPVHIRPDHLDGRAATMLKNTDQLKVLQGRVQLRLDDRGLVW
jgi:hypothetical protein